MIQFPPVDVEFYDQNSKSLALVTVQEHFLSAILGRASLLLGSNLLAASSAIVRHRSDGVAWDWVHLDIHRPMNLPDLLDDDLIYKTEPEIYQIKSYSLKLMPDYGNASVWGPSGECSDFLSVTQHCTDPLAAEQLSNDIDRWQSHYEFFCPTHALSFPMDWNPFMSLGACLCLRSKSLDGLAFPLHYYALSDPESERNTFIASGDMDLDLTLGPRPRDRLWYPTWGHDCSVLESFANQALERLDEEQFIDWVKKGARQTHSIMPWTVYCAHHRLSTALTYLAFHTDIDFNTTCAWGCSVTEASLHSAFATGLELAAQKTSQISSFPTHQKTAIDRLAESLMWNEYDDVIHAFNSWITLFGSSGYQKTTCNFTDPKYLLFFDYAQGFIESFKTQTLLKSDIKPPHVFLSAKKNTL